MSRPDGDATLTAMDRSGEPPRPIAEPEAGARIGRYVIADRLGAGGMGVVYAARDTELARDVALKIVRPRAEVDAMEARLRREAKAMARLSHPNVVPVFDIGTHEGQLFIAMELVTGEPLRSWVAQPRPWRSVVQLFIKAGRGLEAAHAAGLLHRDFKPDNVVVGRGDEPRITDFGLARELDDGIGPGASLAAGMDGELSLITRTGSLAGTPAYMAPEQLLGSQAGAAADQFSFCVSLFEVLHGTRPFRPAVPRPAALIPEIRAGRIAKPRRAVPGWLHAAIVRGLAFDPDRRWPSMTALLDALDRGRRGGRLGVLAVVVGAAVAVGLGVAASLRAAQPAPASCLDVTVKGNDATTVLVCEQEYARSNNPWVGARLADALRRTRKLRQAATVATGLLATPASGDALYTLGKVAVAESRRDDAERNFRLASEQHRAQQQWGESAADLQALALISNDAVDQLVGFDQAAADARRGGDARIEAYCHLGAAVSLSEIGAGAAARAELEQAGRLVSRPADVVQLDLKRGDVEQNLGDNALAAAAFDRARSGAERLPDTKLARSARLNLAYSLAASGKPAEAAAQLQAASVLDPDDQLLAERLSLEARIAASGGELARAAELVERSIAATPPDSTEDLVERCVQRAEIALQQGELTVAERSARRAIALDETLRSTGSPAELRSWLVTDRRIPYELLVASLARQGDAAGALAVFDRYRGLDVLAGLIRGEGAGARPAPTAGGDPPGFPVADLARLVPLLRTSELAAPRSERALDDAVQRHALLALVVARDELWRFSADGGRLQVARLGTLAALRPQLDRFRAAPADPAAAAALGDILVPAELARPSDRVLHVVLDEPLAQLPIAALRVGDRRLIAARPIVQTARASDLGCAARATGPRRVVMLDASSDLARRLVAVSPETTRAALLDAARSDLLHVAAPVASDALGEAFAARDGRVRALDIAGHGRTAAQIVLATPDATTARLAMAFVAAGADQVIATLRPVSNATIERLAEQLYRSDLGDLPRVLARIQRAPDGDDWLGFAVFGRETCNP